MPSKNKRIKTLFPMAGNVDEFINEFDKNKFIIRIDGVPLIQKIAFDFKDYIDPLYLSPRMKLRRVFFMK